MRRRADTLLRLLQDEALLGVQLELVPPQNGCVWVAKMTINGAGDSLDEAICDALDNAKMLASGGVGAR